MVTEFTLKKTLDRLLKDLVRAEELTVWMESVPNYGETALSRMSGLSYPEETYNEIENRLPSGA